MLNNWHLIILTSSWLLASSHGYSQDIQLQGNQIYDSLIVGGLENETYSLYLPREYSDDSLWPVLFIFDPAARAKLAVSVFSEAARKHDFILICSNNSRNGPMEDNFKIAENLVQHALTSYSIDTSRVYMSGFSGGSRLAFSLASSNDLVKGVIGCGAGFPGQKPFIQVDFYYVGIVGNLDMNYLEMKKLEQWMDSIEARCDLIVFNGNHQWPPTRYIEEAFHFINMEHLNNFDNEELELYNNRYLEARAFQRQNELVNAVESFERLIKRYSSFINKDSLSLRVKTIKTEKQYRKQKDENDYLEKQEMTFVADYIGMMKQQLRNPVDSFITVWKNKYQVLKRLRASKKPAESNMATRVISSIRAWCIETGQFSAVNGDYETAITVNLIWVATNPKDSYANFRLSKYYAATGENSKALIYLKRAVKSGFKNKSYILSTNEFQDLQKDNRFIKILSVL